ncbi:MAG: redoxin domain-containing protein [Nitrososphaeria archaeon]|jgi:peroxiredoxin (alkyl hydroperoxide reductase subunit C)
MIEIDELAPDFTADTTKGRLSISDFRHRWVVLFAYPADFTPICEADILGFAKQKRKFDRLEVQFIGWSVDSIETHNRWLKDIKEKTGVDVEYPLIADLGGKIAKTYGILHKTRGILYRGLFVIDPDGVLKFAATYPLEVGRSTKEVERIIKVLQRARELGNLTELERAKELSKYNE